MNKFMIKSQNIFNIFNKSFLIILLYRINEKEVINIYTLTIK